MTLELNLLTDVVAEMGRALAGQEQERGQQVEQARAWLSLFATSAAALEGVAAEAGAAIPSTEPLDYVGPLPSIPQRYTVIGVDGSEVQPDRHGLALYYLINIGSLVYRHGSGETPEAHSRPRLYYREEDLYEGTTLVAGNLLDVRRAHAEVEHLAERVEAEPAGPMLALVDGTLLLWVLEDLPAERRQEKIARYLNLLARIQTGGAALAAFTSRPRYAEVGRLLHLARLGGDVRRAQTEPNPLERLPDQAIFSFLPPGSRSALFASPSPVNVTAYTPRGQRIYFFYVNVAAEGADPEIARVEVPQWVVTAAAPAGEPLLALVHGGVVAQSRILGGFPYVLARADELAYISGAERELLEEMVGAALLAAGVSADLSTKAFYKTLTRRGRRF